MSVEATVSKQLDNNFVQVDITSKNANPKYYKVPAKTADSFMKTYKKQEQKSLMISNVSFALSCVTGCFLTNALTKKFIKSAFAKYTVNTLGGIALSIATMLGVGNMLSSQKQNMLQKHGAQEISYNT